ncbi:metallophosphoesterase family protein [Geomonas oryzae]|uniref:metallophosphoesterase family protein n=1 Tax=Geomonas oryzae TaxID=2364273 RepID=UPI00100C2930|nr:metallophosphoesterase [Geomonas oryzae]
MSPTFSHSRTCKFRSYFSILTLLLLVCFGTVSAAHAETLFKRSSDLMQQLAAKASPSDYSFVVLGDSRGNEAVFKKALSVAATYRPLFILHGGDYSDKGGEEETRKFLSLVESTVPAIPVFVVFGNHESPAVFEKLVAPRQYRFGSKRLGLRVLVVDNAGEELKAPELSFLEKELATAPQATFLAMHVPPETSRWRGHTFSEGAAELQRVIASSSPVQASFFAHSHVYDRDLFGGKPAFISGGAGAPLAWMSRYGERVYHIIVVRVKNGRASYQMVPLK